MSKPNTEGIHSFFNQQAKGWDQVDSHDDKKISHLLDKINIQKGDTILDLGCGTGVISKKLYERSKKQVIALDLSEKMIEIAKEKKIPDEEVHFEVGDFYQLGEIQFSKIIIFNAYPHFLELNAFKEALQKHLKEDGIFAIVHDLGRKQLHDCHKGKDVSLLSRELYDPLKESEIYSDDFTILKAEEGEDYYLLVGQKKKVAPIAFSVMEERDKREKKTRQLLIDTLFSLLKEKKYEEISAIDLIKTSKVSSSTFYSHFKKKEDVLEAFIENVVEHILSEKKRKEENHDFRKERDPESLLSHLFLHFEEEKENLNILFKSKEGKYQFDEMTKEKLYPLFESIIDCGAIEKEGMEHRFLVELITDTFLCYLHLWLKGNTGVDGYNASKQFLKLFRS